MLGHNETQLDSYNKNIPRAQGTHSATQALSSPTGSKNDNIATIKKKAAQPQKPTFPKNTKP